MWQRFNVALQGYNLSVDHNINSNTDTRRGITALAYLNKNNSEVAAQIVEFLHGLDAITPNQYVYPINELHITLLSIISCIDGFTLNDIHAPDYSTLFLEILSELPEFQITFKGVTATPNCIVIQGFPEGDVLALLRERLRKAFKASQLRTSIDSRYTITTAHCTAARFCLPLTSDNTSASNRLNQSELLLAYLQSYRNHSFGTTTIKHVDLVFNDWYQRFSNSVAIAHTLLKTQ